MESTSLRIRFDDYEDNDEQYPKFEIVFISMPK
jgi:hypothetical protein